MIISFHFYCINDLLLLIKTNKFIYILYTINDFENKQTIRFFKEFVIVIKNKAQKLSLKIYNN